MYVVADLKVIRVRNEHFMADFVQALSKSPTIGNKRREKHVHGVMRFGRCIVDQRTRIFHCHSAATMMETTKGAAPCLIRGGQLQADVAQPNPHAFATESLGAMSLIVRIHDISPNVNDSGGFIGVALLACLS